MMRFSYVSWLLALPTQRLGLALTSVKEEICESPLLPFGGSEFLQTPKDRCTLQTVSSVFHASALSGQQVFIHLLRGSLGPEWKAECRLECSEHGANTPGLAKPLGGTNPAEQPAPRRAGLSGAGCGSRLG